MILKQKDDLAPQLAALQRLLTFPKLTKSQREDIEDEIVAIRAGAKGEKESAYHIDFTNKDKQGSIVIHDLRIEHAGRVAQIDHLLISRFLFCHVIESKGFGQEVRITENGEWETRTRYGWRGIPSPVEQNRRHIEVLKALIQDMDLMPKRLGMPLAMEFQNWVLVSPACQLRRSGKEWDQVVKMDLFRNQLSKWHDQMNAAGVIGAYARIISPETLQAFGAKLLQFHKPGQFNFAGKFGIDESKGDERFAPPPLIPLAPVQPPPLPSIPMQKENVPCQSCGEPLEGKVINFCRINSKKFEGKLLCRTCQRPAPSRGCDTCGTDLEDKVIAFCRFNSKKFGGRKLCRSCQSVMPVA